MGSMLMANGEECLDGWVRAGGGEVKGGGVDFGVILLGEIPGESTVKIGAEEFGVEGEAVWTPSRLRCFLFVHCHEGNGDGFLYVLCENEERGFCLDQWHLYCHKERVYRLASVVEMAKAVCFLENHDVRQHLMNVHTPLVLFRSI
ncbi:hypothetical protein Tco_1364162 [Tanacetum coccineum]